MQLHLPYTVLDVFAERPLEGNPLCVFHDARGLSAETMQALARETRLSETTFVFPGDDPEEDRRSGVHVRIFTQQEELPFAGHPTLGTATWLRLYYPPCFGTQEVTLKLKVGPIPVRFPEEAEPVLGGAAAGLYGSMRQRDAEFGAEHDPEEVARVLGLEAADLLPGYRPQTVSTGNPFLIVPLRSLDALQSLRIPQGSATAWLRERASRWFYCIAPEPATGGWRARMQWESGEDPATGSAAGPCIAWLVRNALAASETPVTLRQGIEIARPSRLTVQAKCEPKKVTEINVLDAPFP